MIFFLFLLLPFNQLSFTAIKESCKEKWPFADMNATRSVRPLTAVAK